MAKGYILVRLFKVKDALPITKAKLKITNAENKEVVYENEDAFDISGRSKNIEVITPEKSLSLKPYEEGILPYGVYDIEVDSEKDGKVVVEGVSVFEENTSIQNIEIVHENNKNNFKSSPKQIVISPQKLVMKNGLGTKQGISITPYVLDEVYIPEFIIVHLGAPSAAAENVTVGFIDYIKNVASSEIYPTWPEEALKANIYCQISFALNRIYTEWYRNKGYSFQITNSTAYDQYFIKGRNIFENISKIVDEVFSKYIITIGNKTPFFAQYCNGTTVTCDGLSQWGTVDLAKAGMEAFGIIKYYFGEDKELLRATMIEGIPESYPGTSLRLNDVNENVKVIQKQLNRISRNFPAIPKIPLEDGNFGKDTEEAVKTFQRTFNLTPDGIVGRATWYRISSIYVGVKRLAELEQEPEEEIKEPEGDGKYPGYLLKYGSRGEKVREMQSYLAEIAKYYNIPSILPDGIFGNITKQTVIEFQRLFGLDADGIVGVNTWDMIYNVYKKLELKNIRETYIYSSDYPGYVLKEYLINDDIKWLQTYLNAIAKFYKEIPTIAVDGIYRKRTRNAVSSFQRVFGLSPTGEVDFNNWNKLISVYKSLGDEKDNKRIENIYDYPGFPITIEDEDGYVTILQKYINILSKNNYRVHQVNVTGYFNEETELAVKKLQKEFDLPPTGKVDETTWNKILSIYKALYTGDFVKRKRH
ncbi:peptidoglycan-binding domain-containing protein [Clostridium intestinale]|uniref:Spore cortex-lytic protein n=1 Tax=Clostridium intestinale URNW TaxID=1294142 RepID=U2N0Q9_9CLOT|nr:peptidoglycan-binding protein [Clostridium intestinale]ERK29067.1 spore cortex-lytic protein [Clostridium intestinale URNW]